MYVLPNKHLNLVLSFICYHVVLLFNFFIYSSIKGVLSIFVCLFCWPILHGSWQRHANIFGYQCHYRNALSSCLDRVLGLQLYYCYALPVFFLEYTHNCFV